MRPFIVVLVLTAMHSDLFGQVLVSPSPSVPDTGVRVAPEATALAESYAREREKKARDEERQRHLANVKRWREMSRAMADQIENAESRMAAMDEHLAEASVSDPEIARLKAEREVLVDKAVKTAKGWADTEAVVTSLPQSFIDFLMGRGISIGVSAEGVNVSTEPKKATESTPTPTPTPTPDSPEADSGDGILGVLTSGEFKGTIGTLIAILIAIYGKKKVGQIIAANASSFDQRNEKATMAALLKLFRGLPPQVQPPSAQAPPTYQPRKTASPPAVATAAAITPDVSALQSGEFEAFLLDAITQRHNGRNGNG